MNILIIGYEESLSKIINKFQNDDKVNEIYVIGDTKIDCINLLKPIIQISYQKAKYFKDLNLTDFNLIPNPIDIHSLENLYECESLYLKMIERLSFEIGLDSYNVRLNFYHNNLNFWYNFIKQKNINLVFSAVIPHVGFDFLIFHICKLYDIQNLSFYKLPTIKNNKLYKYLLTDYKNSFIKNPNIIGINEKNDLSFYKETYNTYYENKTFTGKEKIPFYIKFNIFSKLLFFIKNGILIKKFIFLLKYIKYKKNLSSIIKYTNPNINVKYIYLPLHFQPEASTMPLAGFFSDQLLIIEYLASALPPNVFLYIKEHKRKSLIWFNLNRLKKILLNSNIVFISPNFSSVELTENSIAIATATGSTGWEALYKNKFVLVFGNIFYDEAPNVFKIKSTEYLKKVLLDILSNKIIFDKIKFERFVEMIEKNVIEGYSDLRYETNSQTTQETNINNTYKLLKRHLDNLYVPVK